MEQVEKAKAVRDKHYSCFTCTFITACVLLILMEFILIGTGAYFVGLDVFKFQDKESSS
jgi:hypothetical protein